AAGPFRGGNERAGRSRGRPSDRGGRARRSAPPRQRVERSEGNAGGGISSPAGGARPERPRRESGRSGAARGGGRLGRDRRDQLAQRARRRRHLGGGPRLAAVRDLGPGRQRAGRRRVVRDPGLGSRRLGARRPPQLRGGRRRCRVATAAGDGSAGERRVDGVGRHRRAGRAPERRPDGARARHPGLRHPGDRAGRRDQRVHADRLRRRGGLRLGGLPALGRRGLRRAGRRGTGGAGRPRRAERPGAVDRRRPVVGPGHALRGRRRLGHLLGLHGLGPVRGRVLRHRERHLRGLREGAGAPLDAVGPDLHPLLRGLRPGSLQRVPHLLAGRQRQHGRQWPDADRRLRRVPAGVRGDRVRLRADRDAGRGPLV
ncbi:MAG: hypothetical protein AVDCRST_MAG49-4473, partial [uncultured Thermomicrobiales bacterium]